LLVLVAVLVWLFPGVPVILQAVHDGQIPKNIIAWVYMSPILVSLAENAAM
jgi:hypothetical protein